MDTPAPSPCIKVCVVDGATGWCLGCARALSEIGGWLHMNDDEKRKVLESLPERKDTLREMGKLGPAS